MTLDDRIGALEKDILASLQESLRIPSVEGTPEPGMPFGREVARALDHALETAETLGFRTENRDGLIGFAEYGEGEEMIAVLGHLDVVPEGEGWTYPPYGAEIHEGLLYARGVLDNKGPILGALWGLKAIKDLGLPLKRRIRIIFGTNEESGMKGAAWYAAHEEHPLMGFTPDADYPIINVEKGSLGFRCSFALPSDSRAEILEMRGGTVVNAVPEEAVLRMRLPQEMEDLAAELENTARQHPEEFRVTREGNTLTLRSLGKSAHGSTPEQGKNAVTALLVLLGQYASRDSLFALMSRLGDFFHEDTRGEKLGTAFEDDISGALSCNLGLLAKEKDKLVLTLDIRHPVTMDPDSVLPALQRSFGEGALLEQGKKAPPVHVPADSELIRTLQKVYREKTGQEAELLAIGGGTYAKSMANIVAFGPIFPGEPHVIHQPDERVAVSRLMEHIRITASAMYELAR